MVDARREIAVGQAVLPGIGRYQGSDKTALGVGAVVFAPDMGRYDTGTKYAIVFTASPGTSVAEVTARAMQLAPKSFEYQSQAINEPADVQSLSRLKALPLYLAGALVLLVVATVVHALVLGVRRRRRDLAVLRVMGATRKSLRQVGLAQGLTVMAAAAAVGIPVGIVLGRWAWTWLIEKFGSVSVPLIPLGRITLFTLAMAALAAISGVIAVQWGLRRPTAGVLRSD